MNIVENLEILIEEGLSQKEIGEKLGIGQSTVSELLSQKLKSVRYDVGRRLDDLASEARKKKVA